LIIRLFRWLIAIALTVVGTTFVVGPATAAGSTYCTSTGVNVAIDFGALGGGVVKGCGAGSVAADAIQSAGFPLSYVQTGGMSGFVCKVSGKPTPDQGGCTGASGNGYWALFTAYPGGSWTYANLGADSQPVSNGESVSFAWQAPGSGQRSPGTAPAPKLVKPTPSASARPTRGPVATKTVVGGGAPKPTPRVTPKATASATPTKHVTTSATPTPTATATATASVYSLTPQVAHPSSKSGGGLPWWIPVGVVGVLILGAGGTWWRKRAGG
jgi:hypothetical protein